MENCIQHNKHYELLNIIYALNFQFYTFQSHISSILILNNDLIINSIIYFLWTYSRRRRIISCRLHKCTHGRIW